MRHIPRLILAMMLVVIGFGCQPSSKSASVVRLNIKEEPQSLDPRKARQLNSQSILHMLFDGLMREGKEGKLEFAVADSVDISSDLKTYTFHLKNTQWSNADPVTSRDLLTHGNRFYPQPFLLI